MEEENDGLPGTEPFEDETLKEVAELKVQIWIQWCGQRPGIDLEVAKAFEQKAETLAFYIVTGTE